LPGLETNPRNSAGIKKAQGQDSSDDTGNDIAILGNFPIQARKDMGI